MARVMIDCPETGKPVYTGLNFEESDWDAVPVGTRRVECPRCGGIHEWGRTDAYLDDDGYPQ